MDYSQQINDYYQKQAKLVSGMSGTTGVSAPAQPQPQAKPQYNGQDPRRPNIAKGVVRKSNSKTRF